jgi:predicted nucleotide-binding protein (sugar kinase/HSP70/actin superfamily)
VVLSKAELLDPAAKYFRNLNVQDVEFEAKKRKIFKAMYDMKKDLKKKKDKRASISS